jgi:deoxycytidine triphosphate deaminase
MSQLSKNDIDRALKAAWNERLFITPLLGEVCIGESSVDLRLGHQFIVTKKANTPFIGVGTEKSMYGRRNYP